MNPKIFTLKLVYMTNLPEMIADEKHLEELLSTPSQATVEMFKELEGDIIFLGIAGKIGPSLANMAIRACELAGVKKRIIGVSRFSSLEELEFVKSLGVEVFKGDLLDRKFLESLPKVKNVFFLAGMKFGSEENKSLTWAMNTYLPALVAEYYKDSRIVAYSTGCVYPLVPVKSGGATEQDIPEPVGEYAQSCLGRERMFEYGSKIHDTPVALIRLNYAVEPRYGVLVDIAEKVRNHVEIDLSMGHLNVIWQGDANDQVLRSLAETKVPARVINITGEETLSVKAVAIAFGEIFQTPPKFVSEEATTALLSNSKLASDLFGKSIVPAKTIIEWTANWMKDGKKSLGKPTHFEVRDGKY